MEILESIFGFFMVGYRILPKIINHWIQHRVMEIRGVPRICGICIKPGSGRLGFRRKTYTYPNYKSPQTAALVRGKLLRSKIVKLALGSPWPSVVMPLQNREIVYKNFFISFNFISWK